MLIAAHGFDPVFCSRMPQRSAAWKRPAIPLLSSTTGWT